jgi:hypothetical protein
MAKRYANNTNVIYEQEGEVDTNGGGVDPVFYGNLFQSMHNDAPNTFVEMWALCCLIGTDANWGGILNLAHANDSDVWNTGKGLFGWHGYYDTVGTTLDSLDAELRNAGYPTFMSEAYFGNDDGFSDPPWNPWGTNNIANKEAMIFYGWPDGTQHNGACALDLTTINPTWPAD